MTVYDSIKSDEMFHNEIVYLHNFSHRRERYFKIKKSRSFNYLFHQFDGPYFELNQAQYCLNKDILIKYLRYN